MSEKWLEQLKPGDEVIYSHYGEYRILLVEKITPTGMIRVENQLYNKDGSRRGDIYGGHLIECTPERKNTEGRICPICLERNAQFEKTIV